MKHIGVAALVISVLAACSPAPKQQAKKAPAVPPKVQEEAEGAVNIGDVEQGIWITAVMGPQSKAPNISENLLEDARKKVNLEELTIKPPYPKELWLDIKARSFRAFAGTPVVLRAKYTITAKYGAGHEPVKMEKPLFKGIFGKKAHTMVLNDTVDVLKGLDGTPQSILFMVNADVLLMPQGTDEKTIDIDKATTSPERQSVVQSNPVQIKFVQGGDNK